MTRFAVISGLGLAVVTSGCALAAEDTPVQTPVESAETTAAPAAPAGPCDGVDYHAFDFWVGDWDVTDVNGTPQGTNSITREEGGCLLVERWVSAAGNTGQSYNYYDPGMDVWRQVWVSGGAIIDYTGGLTETGSMRLEGVISNRAGTPALPFTGEWTLNEDGTVTQHFEQYNREDDTWAVWFTGIYHKKEG